MAAIERDFKRSVIYQVYVKSFCDSDGDGVGDLPGVTSKLDYLAALGVDYVWLTPFYPSPQRDGGYDVSDYRAVDPLFGTMGDFDELVAEAHRRGIGVMLDMVLCHTSDRHAWFQRALAGEERFRRFYILRDGRGSSGPGDPGEPPTNWQCAFGGPAWEWEPRLGKWYLHMHDVSQPDLDWTNPEVRRACADVVRFWKERGVDGFRFDVVSLISKPEVFEDTPDGSCRRLVADGPHVHEYLQELVAEAGIDGMLTVGEMAATTLGNCIRYTRPEDHELSMTFSFHHRSSSTSAASWSFWADGCDGRDAPWRGATRGTGGRGATREDAGVRPICHETGHMSCNPPKRRLRPARAEDRVCGPQGAVLPAAARGSVSDTQLVAYVSLR